MTGSSSYQYARRRRPSLRLALARAAERREREVNGGRDRGRRHKACSARLVPPHGCTDEIHAVKGGYPTFWVVLLIALAYASRSG
jgi:hypothetical protein